MTWSAFLTANREGFHLADVFNAPLAQRRRRKQRVHSDDSGYISSGTTASVIVTHVPGGNRHDLDTEGSSSQTSSTSDMSCSRKRKLLPVIEERASLVGKNDSTAKLPKDGQNLDAAAAELKSSFQVYRESPESTRNTVDFCKNPIDVVKLPVNVNKSSNESD